MGVSTGVGTGLFFFEIDQRDTLEDKFSRFEIWLTGDSISFRKRVFSGRLSDIRIRLHSGEIVSLSQLRKRGLQCEAKKNKRHSTKR